MEETTWTKQLSGVTGTTRSLDIRNTSSFYSTHNIVLFLKAVLNDIYDYRERDISSKYTQVIVVVLKIESEGKTNAKVSKHSPNYSPYVTVKESLCPVW